MTTKKKLADKAAAAVELIIVSRITLAGDTHRITAEARQFALKNLADAKQQLSQVLQDLTGGEDLTPEQRAINQTNFFEDVAAANDEGLD
jgi:hypothetical protein